MKFKIIHDWQYTEKFEVASFNGVFSTEDWKVRKQLHDKQQMGVVVNLESRDQLWSSNFIIGKIYLNNLSTHFNTFNSYSINFHGKIHIIGFKSWIHEAEWKFTVQLFITCCVSLHWVDTSRASNWSWSRSDEKLSCEEDGSSMLSVLSDWLASTDN